MNFIDIRCSACMSRLQCSRLQFVGRIDPVEYVGVSQKRNGNMRNINHPLCGCATIVIQKSPFHYNRGVQATIRERKGDFMAKQTNSLAHTKWMCKYHIIFTPKYRRKIVYNQYKTDLRDILKQLCSYKGVEIIEGHLMPDHVHMLVSIPPKIRCPRSWDILKGKVR